MSILDFRKCLTLASIVMSFWHFACSPRNPSPAEAMEMLANDLIAFYGDSICTMTVLTTRDTLWSNVRSIEPQDSSCAYMIFAKAECSVFDEDGAWYAMRLTHVIVPHNSIPIDSAFNPRYFDRILHTYEASGGVYYYSTKFGAWDANILDMQGCFPGEFEPERLPF